MIKVTHTSKIHQNGKHTVTSDIPHIKICNPNLTVGKCQTRLSWGTFYKTIELHVQNCQGHESQEKMEDLSQIKKEWKLTHMWFWTHCFAVKNVIEMNADAYLRSVG